MRERGSAAVAQQLGLADAVATSIVACAETRAAFARLARERPASRARHRQRVDQFARDWGRYAVVELSPALAQQAGELAERHALRGFDAIHLASALWLRSSYSGELSFMAFDERLARAANAAGLDTAR